MFIRFGYKYFNSAGPVFPAILAAFLVILISMNGCREKVNQSESSGQNFPIQKYFYKRLEGSVNGKGRIIMNLSRKDTVLTGDFYYEKNGAPVFLMFNSRINQEDSVDLEEQSGRLNDQFASENEGEFSGRFSESGTLKGKWINKKNGDVKDFLLKEKYPPGSYKFTIKSLSKIYGSRTSGGASIEYVYPQILSTGNNNLTAINDNIVQNMFSGYLAIDDEKEYNSFDSEMTDFITRFKKFEKNPLFPKTYKPFWEDSFFANVVFNSDNLIVIEKTDFRYEGGAHPNTYYSFFNYNVKTGRTISLDDIFNSGYKSKLDAIGERLFKYKYSVKQGESLEEAGFFLKNHKFHLNDNFAIFSNGILFKFNPYEIAAYVFGAPEVFIPYSELNSLMKKNSDFTELIK